MVCMELSDSSQKIVSARELGLVACRSCTKVHRVGESRTCQRCGRKLRSRDELAIQRVWAWWLVGVMAYIPANLYPMLETRTLFTRQADTIVGGAVDLIHHGAFGIAAIILLASVAIPLGKFAAIALLALSLSRRSSLSMTQLRLVHEVVEYVGRWSMIDIFVVAILSSLVQLSSLASIRPGTASLFFALSVIFTMVSAQNFDSRLIWDSRQRQEAK